MFSQTPRPCSINMLHIRLNGRVRLAKNALFPVATAPIPPSTTMKARTAMLSGTILAIRLPRKSRNAPGLPCEKESWYVYAMMKPLRTKNKCTAIYPCGTRDGIVTAACVWAVAEKCCMTTAIAATPRSEVRDLISNIVTLFLISPRIQLNFRDLMV